MCSSFRNDRMLFSRQYQPRFIVPFRPRCQPANFRLVNFQCIILSLSNKQLCLSEFTILQCIVKTFLRISAQSRLDILFHMLLNSTHYIQQKHAIHVYNVYNSMNESTLTYANLSTIVTCELIVFNMFIQKGSER